MTPRPGVRAVTPFPRHLGGPQAATLPAMALLMRANLINLIGSTRGAAPTYGRARPRRAAYAPASLRVRTPSLRSTADTW
jgi:hypothetical protein